MNLLYEEQLGGDVVDADGRGRVCQELVGGPCRYCGRTRQKTRFCQVCGAVLCETCLNSTRCDALPPDRGMWSHGRAMRVRGEERDRRVMELAFKRVSGVVAPPHACEDAADGAPGVLGEVRAAPGSSESLDDAKVILRAAAEGERLAEQNG